MPRNTDLINSLNSILHTLTSSRKDGQRNALSELRSTIEKYQAQVADTLLSPAIDEIPPLHCAVGLDVCSNLVIVLLDRYIKPFFAGLSSKSRALQTLSRDVTTPFRHVFELMHRNISFDDDIPPLSWRRCRVLPYLLQNILEMLSADAFGHLIEFDYSMLVMRVLSFRVYVSNLSELLLHNVFEVLVSIVFRSPVRYQRAVDVTLSQFSCSLFENFESAIAVIVCHTPFWNGLQNLTPEVAKLLMLVHANHSVMCQHVRFGSCLLRIAVVLMDYACREAGLLNFYPVLSTLCDNWKHCTKDVWKKAMLEYVQSFLEGLNRLEFPGLRYSHKNYLHGVNQSLGPRIPHELRHIQLCGTLKLLLNIVCEEYVQICDSYKSSTAICHRSSKEVSGDQFLSRLISNTIHYVQLCSSREQTELGEKHVRSAKILKLSSTQKTSMRYADDFITNQLVCVNEGKKEKLLCWLTFIRFWLLTWPEDLNHVRYRTLLSLFTQVGLDESIDIAREAVTSLIALIGIPVFVPNVISAENLANTDEFLNSNFPLLLNKLFSFSELAPSGLHVLEILLQKPHSRAVLPTDHEFWSPAWKFMNSVVSAEGNTSPSLINFLIRLIPSIQDLRVIQQSIRIVKNTLLANTTTQTIPSLAQLAILCLSHPTTRAVSEWLFRDVLDFPFLIKESQKDFLLAMDIFHFSLCFFDQSYDRSKKSFIFTFECGAKDEFLSFVSSPVYSLSSGILFESKKNLQSLLSVLLAQHDAILEFSLLLDDSAAQHKTKPSQSVRSHAMNEMSHIQTSTNAIMQYLLDLYRSTCSYWCPTAYNSVSKNKYEVGNRSALCFEQSITISMILFRILSKVFSENALQTSTLLEFCFSKLDELELASPTAQFYKMKKTNIYIHWIYCTCDRKSAHWTRFKSVLSSAFSVHSYSIFSSFIENLQCMLESNTENELLKDALRLIEEEEPTTALFFSAHSSCEVALSIAKQVSDVKLQLNCGRYILRYISLQELTFMTKATQHLISFLFFFHGRDSFTTEILNTLSSRLLSSETNSARSALQFAITLFESNIPVVQCRCILLFLKLLISDQFLFSVFLVEFLRSKKDLVLDVLSTGALLIGYDWIANHELRMFPLLWISDSANWNTMPQDITDNFFAASFLCRSLGNNHGESAFAFLQKLKEPQPRSSCLQHQYVSSFPFIFSTMLLIRSCGDQSLATGAQKVQKHFQIAFGDEFQKNLEESKDLIVEHMFRLECTNFTLGTALSEEIERNRDGALMIEKAMLLLQDYSKSEFWTSFRWLSAFTHLFRLLKRRKNDDFQDAMMCSLVVVLCKAPRKAAQCCTPLIVRSILKLLPFIVHLTPGVDKFMKTMGVVKSTLFHACHSLNITTTEIIEMHDDCSIAFGSVNCQFSFDNRARQTLSQYSRLNVKQLFEEVAIESTDCGVFPPNPPRNCLKDALQLYFRGGSKLILGRTISKCLKEAEAFANSGYSESCFTSLCGILKDENLTAFHIEALRCLCVICRMHPEFFCFLPFVPEACPSDCLPRLSLNTEIQDHVFQVETMHRVCSSFIYSSSISTMETAHALLSQFWKDFPQVMESMPSDCMPVVLNWKNGDHVPSIENRKHEEPKSDVGTIESHVRDAENTYSKWIRSTTLELIDTISPAADPLQGYVRVCAVSDSVAEPLFLACLYYSLRDTCSAQARGSIGDALTNALQDSCSVRISQTIIRNIIKIYLEISIQVVRQGGMQSCLHSANISETQHLRVPMGLSDLIGVKIPLPVLIDASIKACMYLEALLFIELGEEMQQPEEKGALSREACQSLQKVYPNLRHGNSYLQGIGAGNTVSGRLSVLKSEKDYLGQIQVVENVDRDSVSDPHSLFSILEDAGLQTIPEIVIKNAYFDRNDESTKVLRDLQSYAAWRQEQWAEDDPNGPGLIEYPASFHESIFASLRGLSKGFGSEFLRAVHFGEQALSLDKSISLDEKLSLFFAFDTLRSFPDLRFHTGEPLIFTKDTNVGHINIPHSIPYPHRRKLVNLQLCLLRIMDKRELKATYILDAAQAATSQGAHGGAFSLLHHPTLRDSSHIPSECAKIMAKCMWKAKKHSFAMDLMECRETPECILQLAKWKFKRKVDTTPNILNKVLTSCKGMNDDVSYHYASARFYDAMFSELESKMRSNEHQIFVEQVDEIRRNRQQQKLGYQKLQSTLSEHKKRHIKRHLTLQEREHKIMLAELERNVNDREALCLHCLRCYAQVLQHGGLRSDKLLASTYRFVSLWFANLTETAVNRVVSEKVGMFPTSIFLPLFPQLCARLGIQSDDGEFQNILRNLIIRVVNNSPQPALYTLFSMRNGAKYPSGEAELHVISQEKIDAANSILKQLSESDHQMKIIISELEVLTNAYIELAFAPASRFTGANPQITTRLSKLGVLSKTIVPTAVSYTNAPEREVVQAFLTSISLPGGLNQPKLITCRSVAGHEYRQLVKSKDDLRQDALVEQVFSLCNDLFQHKRSTSSTKIRTYIVVPLTPTSGLVQWVENSLTLGQYLIGQPGKEHTGAHHRYYPQDMPHDTARSKMQSVGTQSASDKLQMYSSVCSKLHPCFNKFFLEHFSTPVEWYTARLAYTNSVASSSMVGHIVGLGDRHTSNILIDKCTGEVIHIDIGLAFDEGLLLPIPEVIPFRLTRDMVDGLGITGARGLFRVSCESVMELLRDSKEMVHTVVQTLLHDPLAKWAVDISKVLGTSAGTSAAADECIDAYQASSRTLMKLNGVIGNRSLTVCAHVHLLILEATSEKNLASLYPGWAPWL